MHHWRWLCVHINNSILNSGFVIYSLLWHCHVFMASQVVLVVKNLSANVGEFNPWVRKIPWSRETATHCSILAWKISWTEEPGGLQCMGLQSWTQPSTHTDMYSYSISLSKLFSQTPKLLVNTLYTFFQLSPNKNKLNRWSHLQFHRKIKHEMPLPANFTASFEVCKMLALVSRLPSFFLLWKKWGTTLMFEQIPLPASPFPLSLPLLHYPLSPQLSSYTVKKQAQEAVLLF